LIHFYKRINAMMARMLLVTGLVAGMVKAETPVPDDFLADKGNWTVTQGNQSCIMVTMAGTFMLTPDKTNTNTSVTVDIPMIAAVSNQSSCDVASSNGTQQTLVLEWSDKDPEHEEETLDRSFTVQFNVNTTTGHYGVSKINGVYEWRSLNGTDPKTNQTILVKDIISFTTFALSPWKFSVETNKSYLCLDLGSMSMEAELHKSNEPALDPGEKLPNATFSATDVRLDAFRAVTVPTGVFQTPADCSYRPNDVVPIIVGCALAGMVVMVLIAYMVGRSRSRARGYQSV